MNLLFIGCSHLSGSWDNPFDVDIQTGILSMVAQQYPQHSFTVHAFPGQGLLTFLDFMRSLPLHEYSGICIIGDYYRLSYPCRTLQTPKHKQYEMNNYVVHEYRSIPFYTAYPPNCIDPTGYDGDRREFVVQMDTNYVMRKTYEITQLLLEDIKYPVIGWSSIWSDMREQGIPVEAYWSHPTDRHFTQEGNTLAVPFLIKRLQEVNLL